MLGPRGRANVRAQVPGHRDVYTDYCRRQSQSILACPLSSVSSVGAGCRNFISRQSAMVASVRSLVVKEANDCSD